MDVIENSPTNAIAIDINDEELVDVSMGIDATSTENTEEKELSPTKKKDRAKVGKHRLRSPAWESFDLLPVDEDNKKRAKSKHCGIVYVCDSRIVFPAI
ncbi:unnamed protein product [Prunus armeniaca]|uniref:Uncharacterized protein n=1 Tax=Prunus armeniaca TaxID=36596 RepID=A0A6J5W7N0_PRUAR|nr:unnamed protein product [Prunus armeniaca]